MSNPSPRSGAARLLLASLSPLLLCTSLAQAAAGALNDTGITFCGDASTNTANCATVADDGGAFPRQDARYGRDAQAAAGQLSKIGGGGAGFDFTKIANNGSVLPATAGPGSGPGEWACTKDNVTGLIWEIKTSSGLRSLSHTYTWYNRNPAANGGGVGTASGGTCFASGSCDTEKYTADVNAIGLCGASDWRMPTVKELESIVNYGRTNPSVEWLYFSDTQSAGFWSGSPDAYSSNNAWYVNFDNGYAYSDGPRANAGLVRLVRSDE
ncbi:MAG TPA: DUF1566 domain-containing protein [Rhodoferax sp.]|nr:DUF1566 domain-containing protein [Rhodoferax sp.]